MVAPGPHHGGAAREKWESLTALAALADDLFAMSPQSRIADLVRELDERAASQHAPTVEGVTLARCTLPRAWVETVHLVGCSDGLLPISMAETPRPSRRSAGCSMSG